MGHRFTADGIVADSEKVAAILDMPAPTVPLLRQVMGMIHFLGSYLPDLDSVTRPLNDLLLNDTVWAWGPAQEEVFVKMKMLAAFVGEGRTKWASQPKWTPPVCRYFQSYD